MAAIADGLTEIMFTSAKNHKKKNRATRPKQTPIFRVPTKSEPIWPVVVLLFWCNVLLFPNCWGKYLLLCGE